MWRVAPQGRAGGEESPAAAGAQQAAEQVAACMAWSELRVARSPWRWRGHSARAKREAGEAGEAGAESNAARPQNAAAALVASSPQCGGPCSCWGGSPGWEHRWCPTAVSAAACDGAVATAQPHCACGGQRGRLQRRNRADQWSQLIALDPEPVRPCTLLMQGLQRVPLANPLASASAPATGRGCSSS